MHRRGLTATIMAGLLLLLPSAALAQDTAVGVGTASSVEGRDPSAQEDPAEDQVGIGEPDSVVCRGTVTAAVVDLDGATVGGAVLSVANQQISGSGTVDADCGEVGATLLSAPEGYAPAGPTSMSVPVRHQDTTRVTFTVDQVEVLGTQFEQPAQAEPAPDTQVQTSSAPNQQVAAELPATGPEDASTLLLLALLSGLFGTVLVAGAPALARSSERD